VVCLQRVYIGIVWVCVEGGVRRKHGVVSWNEMGEWGVVHSTWVVVVGEIGWCHDVVNASCSVVS